MGRVISPYDKRGWRMCSSNKGWLMLSYVRKSWLPWRRKIGSSSRCKQWARFICTWRIMWWSMCLVRFLRRWYGWCSRRCIWQNHSSIFSSSGSSSTSFEWVRGRACKSILATFRRSSLISSTLMRKLRKRPEHWSSFITFLFFWVFGDYSSYEKEHHQDGWCYFYTFSEWDSQTKELSFKFRQWLDFDGDWRWWWQRMKQQRIAR